MIFPWEVCIKCYFLFCAYSLSKICGKKFKFSNILEEFRKHIGYHRGSHKNGLPTNKELCRNTVCIQYLSFVTTAHEDILLTSFSNTIFGKNENQLQRPNKLQWASPAASHLQVARCLTIVPFVFQGDLSWDLRLTRQAVSFQTGPTVKRPGQGHLHWRQPYGDLDTGSIKDPALTCSLWTTTSLTIMMLMRFPTLGSLYTAATCNKDKTHRQKMQTSTNLNQSTDMDMTASLHLSTWNKKKELLLVLVKLHGV